MSGVREFYGLTGYAKEDHDYSREDRFVKICRQISRYIDAEVKSAAPIQIIDLGCGVGGFLRYLRGLYVSRSTPVALSGLDLSPTLIEENLSAGVNSGISFYSGDISSHGFDIKRKFDIVILGEVIEHVADTDTAILNCLSLLDKNGILIITTPNLASWLDRAMLLFGMQPFSTEVSYVDRVFGRRKFYSLFGVSSSQAVGHLRLFTPGALIDLCKFHGAQLVSWEGYWQQPFTVNKVVSRACRSLAEGIIVVLRPGR